MHSFRVGNAVTPTITGVHIAYYHTMVRVGRKSKAVARRYVGHVSAESAGAADVAARFSTEEAYARANSLAVIRDHTKRGLFASKVAKHT